MILTERGKKIAETVVKKVWYVCYMDGVPGIKSDEPTVVKKEDKEVEDNESDKRRREEREYEEKEVILRHVDAAGKVVSYETVKNKEYFKKYREVRMIETHFYRKKGTGWRVFREKRLTDRKSNVVKRTKKIVA